MKKIIRSKKFWIISILIVLSIIYISDKLIEQSAKNSIYSEISDIPSNKVALVLGTSKLNKNGFENLFFKYRIEATVTLYKAGKIKYIIVSGDNHVVGYDEPNDMKLALIEKGIPGNIIYLDYAGFRTYDSIIRCKEVFGETNITIISQLFHNERALFIANKYGMHAIAFNAKDVNRKYGFATLLREKFARVKCVIDLYLIPANPHFLGTKISIPS